MISTLNQCGSHFLVVTSTTTELIRCQKTGAYERCRNNLIAVQYICKYLMRLENVLFIESKFFDALFNIIKSPARNGRRRVVHVHMEEHTADSNCRDFLVAEMMKASLPC